MKNKKKMLKGCVEKGRLRVVRRGGERMRKILPRLNNSILYFVIYL